MSIFKKIIALGCLIGLCVALTGCGPSKPQMFGMPQSQFNQLSASQKQETIQQYNDRQAASTSRKQIWGGVMDAAHPHKTLHKSETVSPRSCYTKPDGTVVCTQKKSSSSFGIGIN